MCLSPGQIHINERKAASWLSCHSLAFPLLSKALKCLRVRTDGDEDISTQ